VKSKRLGLVVGAVLASTYAQAEPWTITVSGTIQSGGGTTGIFGTPGLSLVGLSYTETITTDPLLNTNIAGSAAPDSTYLERYGGAVIGCCGAPFTISVTVNGFTYTQSNANPFINRSYLIDGLSTGLGG
jgi:hypothetical protein